MSATAFVKTDDSSSGSQLTVSSLAESYMNRHSASSNQKRSNLAAALLFNSGPNNNNNKNNINFHADSIRPKLFNNSTGNAHLSPVAEPPSIDKTSSEMVSPRRHHQHGSSRQHKHRCSHRHLVTGRPRSSMAAELIDSNMSTCEYNHKARASLSPPLLAQTPQPISPSQPVGSFRSESAKPNRVADTIQAINNKHRSNNMPSPSSTILSENKSYNPTSDKINNYRNHNHNNNFDNMTSPPTVSFGHHHDRNDRHWNQYPVQGSSSSLPPGRQSRNSVGNSSPTVMSHPATTPPARVANVDDNDDDDDYEESAVDNHVGSKQNGYKIGHDQKSIMSPLNVNIQNEIASRPSSANSPLVKTARTQNRHNDEIASNDTNNNNRVLNLAGSLPPNPYAAALNPFAFFDSSFFSRLHPATASSGDNKASNNETNSLNTNSDLQQQQSQFPGVAPFYWPPAAYLAAAAAAAQQQQQQSNGNSGSEAQPPFAPSLWYPSPFFYPPYPPQSGWPGIPPAPSTVPPPPQFQDNQSAKPVDKKAPSSRRHSQSPSGGSNKMGVGASSSKILSTAPSSCISPFSGSRSDATKLLPNGSTSSVARKRDPSPASTGTNLRKRESSPAGKVPVSPSRANGGKQNKSNSKDSLLSTNSNATTATTTTTKPPIPPKPRLKHTPSQGAVIKKPGSMSPARPVSSNKETSAQAAMNDAFAQTQSPTPGFLPSSTPSTAAPSTVTIAHHQNGRMGCDTDNFKDDWTVAEPTPPGSDSGGDAYPHNENSKVSSFCSQFLWEPRQEGVVSCLAETAEAAAMCLPNRRSLKTDEHDDAGVCGECLNENHRRSRRKSSSPERKPSSPLKRQDQSRASSRACKSPPRSPRQMTSLKSTTVQSVRSPSPSNRTFTSSSISATATASSTMIAAHAIKISIDGVTPPPIRKTFTESNRDNMPRRRRGPSSLDDPTERRTVENDGIIVTTSRSANSALHRQTDALSTTTASAPRQSSRPSSRRTNTSKGKFNTIDRTFFRSREEYEDFAKAVKQAADGMRKRNSKRFGGISEDEQQHQQSPSPRPIQESSFFTHHDSPAKQMMSRSYDETTSNSTSTAGPANGAYNVALQTATSHHQQHHHHHSNSNRRQRNVRSEIVDVDAFDAASDGEQYHQNGNDDLNNDDKQFFVRNTSAHNGGVYVDASSDQGGPGGSGTDEAANFSKQGSFINSQTRYKKKCDTTALRGSTSRQNRYATARERRLSIGASVAALGAPPSNGTAGDTYDNDDLISSGSSKHARKSILSNGQNKLAMMSKQQNEIGQLVSMFGNEIPCSEHPGCADSNNSSATTKVVNGNTANAPPATAYCTVCYAALCRQCAQKSQHGQHSIVTLETGAKRRMHEMQQTCRDIDERAKQFEQSLHQLVKENKELKRHKSNVKSQIQTTCNRLVNAITLRAEQMLQELDDVYNAAEGEYIRQRDDTDRALLVLRGTKKFAQNLLLNLDNAHYRALLLSSKVENELNRLVAERALPSADGNANKFRELGVAPDGSNFWFEENPNPVIRATDLSEMSMSNIADLVDFGRLVVSSSKHHQSKTSRDHGSSNTTHHHNASSSVSVTSVTAAQQQQTSLPQIVSCSTKDQTPPASSSSSTNGGGTSTANSSFAVTEQRSSVIANQQQSALAQLAKIIAPPASNEYARIELLFDFHCHIDTDRTAPMPECITCGPQGQLLLTDSANRKIKVYRPDGIFMMEIQCRSQPYGIAVLGQDKFAVTLYDEVGQKATVEFYELAGGNYLRALAYTSECQNRRMAIAATTTTASSGNIAGNNTGFVLTDSDCNQLRLYDSTGQLLSSFDLHAITNTSNRSNSSNGKSSATSCFAHHVVYVDGSDGVKRTSMKGGSLSAAPSEPLLVASLLDSSQICAIGAHSGKLAFRYGSQGIGREQLSSPCGLAVDPRGNIVAADSGNSRLHVLSPTGNLLCHLPPHLAKATPVQQRVQQSNSNSIALRHPKAIAMAPNVGGSAARLVVAERGGHVKVFSYCLGQK